MSDDFLILVPRNPRLVPSASAQTSAVAVLKTAVPEAQNVTAETHDHVQFFDCGENFQTIECPNCSSVIDIDWWDQQMGADHDGDGFRLQSYLLPCCGQKASLNELTYDWPQAFGRFSLTAENPNIGALSAESLNAVEVAAGTPLTTVRQHL